MECMVLAQMNVSYKVTVHDLVAMEAQLAQVRHMVAINGQVLASIATSCHPHLHLLLRGLLEQQLKMDSAVASATTQVNRIYKEILEACREQAEAD